MSFRMHALVISLVTKEIRESGEDFQETQLAIMTLYAVIALRRLSCWQENITQLQYFNTKGVLRVNG